MRGGLTGCGEVLLGAGRSLILGAGGLTGRKEVLLGARRAYWAQGVRTVRREILLAQATAGWFGPGDKECRSAPT